MLKMQMEEIKKQLHIANFKLTPQREATVRILIENQQEHLSAEDIYMLVKRQAPDIGLATVYRTLELLSELQIVDKVNFGDGVSRYDFRVEGMEHFHHHTVCTSCGSVEEIQEDLLEEIEAYIERKYDFKITDHQLNFHGVCKKCRMQQKESSTQTLEK